MASSMTQAKARKMLKEKKKRSKKQIKFLQAVAHGLKSRKKS